MTKHVVDQMCCPQCGAPLMGYDGLGEPTSDTLAQWQAALSDHQADCPAPSLVADMLARETAPDWRPPGHRPWRSLMWRAGRPR